MSAVPEFRFVQSVGREAERVCAALVDSLTTGTPQSFADYKFLQGQLQAWRDILDFAKAENDRFMKD